MNDGPPDDTPEFRRVDPRMRRLWFSEELFGTVLLGGGALALDRFVLSTQIDGWPIPRWWTGAAVVVGLLLWACVSPGLRYRNWRYAMRQHDVLLMYGIVWKVRRSIPRLRIQHVDVRAGPLSRMVGLVHLTLFTAGTGDADAVIPGLLPEQAEGMRDALLAANARDADERRGGTPTVGGQGAPADEHASASDPPTGARAAHDAFDDDHGPA